MRACFVDIKKSTAYNWIKNKGINVIYVRAKETDPRISGNDTTKHIQKG